MPPLTSIGKTPQPQEPQRQRDTVPEGSLIASIQKVGEILEGYFLPISPLSYTPIDREKVPPPSHSDYSHITEFAIKVTEGIRLATNLFNVTLSQFNTTFADVLYEVASINWSLGNLSKLTRGAKAFDLSASVSNTLASGAAWFDRGVKKGHLALLKQKVKTEAAPKKKAELNFQIKALEKEVGEGVDSLALSSLASVAYLVGSVGNIISKAPGWISPAFGSIAFGVLYAGSKVLDLKADFDQSKQMKIDIAEYKKRAEDSSSPPHERQIYQMKAAALENYLKKYNKWRKVENALDIVVGVTAAVAGVIAFTAAGAASFGTIPLAVALGASIGFKLGKVAYQNLKDPESRAKAKLAIEVVCLTVLSKIPKYGKVWKDQLPDTEKAYLEAKAKELTKQDFPENHVKIFVHDKIESKLKATIAEELGLFNNEGKPDPTQVTVDHVNQWLIST